MHRDAGGDMRALFGKLRREHEILGAGFFARGA